MQSRIREVRRARGMTLADVAAACDPPTTPQTVGRLETGMRTLSVDWLNRIAAALEVESSALVDTGGARDIPVAALLAADGIRAPGAAAIVIPPTPVAGQLAILVKSGIGDYRAGDEIWCDRIEADGFAGAINRDVLVPRPAGRFLFGRLLGREGDRLHLLPLGAGARQQVLSDPPWIGVATRLVRSL